MAKAEIVLFGRSYSIACASGQEARLVSLAEELDGRLSRISRAVGDVGEDRLLIVAALSLLDELHAAQPATPGESAATERAASALADAAARIEAMAARAETHVNGHNAPAR